MPPKGSQKSASCLGTVYPHHDGWRVRATIGARTVCGPYRFGRGDAEADLSLARRAETHEEYCSILKQLRDSRESSGSGSVTQPAHSQKEEGVVGAAVVAGGLEAEGEVTARVRKRPAAALETECDSETLLLRVARPHYVAIKSGRKVWEARPMYERGKDGWHESTYMRLGTVGRVARLQCGVRWGGLVRIAETRDYKNVKDMVEDLGAQLLPDAADADARVKVLEELYADEIERGCGFLAMR